MVVTTYFAIMLVLPMAIVLLFFGIVRSRLRGRFSLRTLLIVTTFLSVALGMIVWAADHFNH